jgi:hypothetical protein
VIEVGNPSGRLVTYRVRQPVDDGNAEHAGQELRRVIERIEGRVVVCTDLTDARTFAPSTTERFVRVMKADNPRLERSAILLASHAATFTLQLERMLREATGAARRVFHDPRELSEWLQPLLSAPEQAALLEFLAGAVG